MNSKPFLFLNGSKFRLDKIESVLYRPAHIQIIKTSISDTVFITPPCLHIKIFDCEESLKLNNYKNDSRLTLLNIYGYPAVNAVKTLRSFEFYSLEESMFLIEQLNAELEKMKAVFDIKVKNGFAICNFHNFKDNFSVSEVKLSSRLSDIHAYQNHLSLLGNG